MIIFTDTETTGLPLPLPAKLELQPHITEIYAALTDDNGNIVKEFETLVNPEVPIPDFITKITGIDNMTVINEPTFNDIHKKLTKFFRKADTLVAHNLSFDKGLFDFEYQRLGFEKSPLPVNLFCTVEQSMHIKGFRLRLKELHEMVTGLPEIPGAHRAKNDVLAMIKCWKWLKEYNIENL